MKHPDDRLHDYLVGALNEREDAAVEAHLDTCEMCRDALRRLNETLVVMVETLPPVVPPDNLLHSVKARTLAPLPPPGKVVPNPSFLPWTLLTAVSLLLAGSLALSTRTYQAFAQARGEGQQVAEGLATEGAALLTVHSSTSGRLGAAILLPDEKILYVLLSPPPKAKAYQVWGIRDDSVTSLAIAQSKVFEVRRTNFNRLRLSLEPAQGSPSPTRVLAENELPPSPQAATETPGNASKP